MTRRRDFLKQSGALAIGGMLFPNLHANNLFSPNEHLDKIGLQLFSIPKLLEQDFAGTMK